MPRLPRAVLRMVPAIAAALLTAARAEEPSLHDLRTKILSTDQVLLEYRIRGEGGTVRLVAQDRERTGEVGVGRRAIAARVTAMRAQIAAGDTALPAATELYALLVAPVAADLPPAARLVVVPDGSLDALPFAALRAAGGAFLAEGHAISFATSAAALAGPAGRRPRRPKAAPDLQPAAVDSFLTANGVTLRRAFGLAAPTDSLMAVEMARALAAGAPPDIALQRAQTTALRAGLPVAAWAGYSVTGRMSAPRRGGTFPAWIVPLGLAAGAGVIALGLRLAPRRRAADDSA